MRCRWIVVCLAALAACDQSVPGPPGPSNSSPTPAPADPLEVAVAAADGSEILAYKMLARHVDGWYRGRQASVVLTFQPDGTASDGAGHSVPIAPAQWKGIVARVRAATPERPIEAVASIWRIYDGSTLMPKDDFGRIPRYRYRLKVVSDDKLRFVNNGKYDEGG